MSTKKRTSPVLEFFEIVEVSKGQEKVKKAVCKLCEDLQLAYGGGTSILIHHLEAKHVELYTLAFGGSSSESKKKQTTCTVVLSAKENLFIHSWKRNN